MLMRLGSNWTYANYIKCRCEKAYFKCTLLQVILVRKYSKNNGVIYPGKYPLAIIVSIHITCYNIVQRTYSTFLMRCGSNLTTFSLDVQDSHIVHINFSVTE